MKLKSDLNFVEQEFTKYIKENREKVINHIDNVKQAKEYNNLHVRIGYDIARVTKVLSVLTDKYWNDREINNNHYQTLFIAALTFALKENNINIETI